MTNRSGFFFVTLVGVAFMIGCLTAQAEFYYSSWQDEITPYNGFRGTPTFGYMQTDVNFDKNGAAFIPANLTGFSALRFDLTGSYGFSNRFSVFARGSWERVQLDTAKTSINQFGFPDQTVGFNYRLWKTETESRLEEPEVAIDLQIQGDFPAYDNKAAASKSLPFLGDGSLDGSVGGFMTLNLGKNLNGRWKLHGGTAYTYRTGGFSAALPATLVAQFDPYSKGIVAEAGVTGVFSLRTDDVKKETAIGEAHQSFGAGGSYYINAYNPTHFSAIGKIGYKIGKTLLAYISGKRTFYGLNSPQIFAVAGGLQMSWMEESNYTGSNKGFINYGLKAKVKATNDKLGLIKVDQGADGGVRDGDTFDVLEIKADGTIGDVIARAKTKSVHADETVLTVQEYFKEVWIQPGFIVRRPLD